MWQATWGSIKKTYRASRGAPDLLISTLSGYVEAMGGKLHLVAEFPDRPPVTLTGIGALAEKDITTES